MTTPKRGLTMNDGSHAAHYDDFSNLSSDAQMVLANLCERGRGENDKRGLLGPSTSVLALTGTSRPDASTLNLARCYLELVYRGVVREVAVSTRCSQYILTSEAHHE